MLDVQSTLYRIDDTGLLRNLDNAVPIFGSHFQEADREDILTTTLSFGKARTVIIIIIIATVSCTVFVPDRLN